MTDTLRTQAELLTLFGDLPVVQNRITPQNMRDLIISIPGQAYPILSSELGLVTNLAYPNGDVRRFGAIQGGTIDATTAFNNWITWGNAYATATGGAKLTAPGRYLITAALNTVTSHRVHIDGDGKHATQIVFNPSADADCFTFSAAVLTQCSIRGFGFTSTDTTHTKNAIHWVDTSEMSVSDIAVTNWTGGASRGLWSQGREFTHAWDLSLHRNSTSTSSFFQPIQVSVNPNSTISCDHAHFHDTYLIPSSGNPSVLIDDGVNLTSLTIDGHNSWVAGTHGLYWNNTTSAIASQFIKIAGVRTEQGEDATAYSIYIASSNAQIQSVSIEAPNGLDLNKKGIYLRGVFSAALRNVWASTTSREVLNIDGTVHGLDLYTCFWNTGSTATTTGTSEIWGIWPNIANRPLPTTGSYQSNTSNENRGAFQINQTKVMPFKGTLTAGSQLQMPAMAGFSALWINVVGYASVGPISAGGSVSVTPAGSTLQSAADPNFAATNTAGKLCYLVSATPTIINNTAQTMVVTVSATWS